MREGSLPPGETPASGVVFLSTLIFFLAIFVFMIQGQGGPQGTKNTQNGQVQLLVDDRPGAVTFSDILSEF